MSGVMRYTMLIETSALAAGLDDSSLVVVDCRFDLNDTAAGERGYSASHVPGAVYAHLDRDLSGTKTGTNGRHPLPEVRAAAETFGRLGIEGRTQVVAYDYDAGMYASRLWWMLRWLGHDAVAVLNGGFKKWVAEGRPVAAGVERVAPRVFVPRPRPEMLVTLDEVAAIVSKGAEPGWQLLDARAGERFRGEVEPIDRVPGHIPGARNRPYQANVHADGTFRPPGELAGEFREVLGDGSPEHTINYCGSGVTACHNVLALELAGMPGTKLYPGSWSEWSSHPSRPLERADPI
jgi:thiosulfate/3-mercaptopyruvate sulfurtransferase